MFGNQFYSSSFQEDEDYNKLLETVMGVDYTIFYRGIVVDNDDPEHLGRVRVRVPQIYGSEDQRDKDYYAPNVSIPWATSAIMAGAGNNTGAYLIPNIGDVVLVTFENGDANLPLYFGGLLTSGGTNRFIGTKDVNNGEYYKSSGDDFNTDITNKSQRVLYKSIKGATIIVDDKDGSESIKIIDQLGQMISMENYSGQPLNRDRSGGVDTRERSGRIVIKDAYDDSIAFYNGEIHIKAPKIVIETDDLDRVGLNNQFPDEVDLADTILGDGDEPDPPIPPEPDPPIPPEPDPPTPTGKSYYVNFINNSTRPVMFGVLWDYTESYAEKNRFDFIAKLYSPDQGIEGQTSDVMQVPDSDINNGYFYVSCLDYDSIGRFNVPISWGSYTSEDEDYYYIDVYASDFVDNKAESKQYISGEFVLTDTTPEEYATGEVYVDIIDPTEADNLNERRLTNGFLNGSYYLVDFGGDEFYNKYNDTFTDYGYAPYTPTVEVRSLPIEAHKLEIVIPRVELDQEGQIESITRITEPLYITGPIQIGTANVQDRFYYYNKSHGFTGNECWFMCEDNSLDIRSDMAPYLTGYDPLGDGCDLSFYIELSTYYWEPALRLVMTNNSNYCFDSVYVDIFENAYEDSNGVYHNIRHLMGYSERFINPSDPEYYVDFRPGQTKNAFIKLSDLAKEPGFVVNGNFDFNRRFSASVIYHRSEYNEE